MTMRGEVHCSAALHSLSLSLGMNCSLQLKEKMLRLVDNLQLNSVLIMIEYCDTQ